VNRITGTLALLIMAAAYLFNPDKTEDKLWRALGVRRGRIA
jgi:hypothetical protein